MTPSDIQTFIRSDTSRFSHVWKLSAAVPAAKSVDVDRSNIRNCRVGRGILPLIVRACRSVRTWASVDDAIAADADVGSPVITFERGYSRAASSCWQACSQRRHASAHTRQCSCIAACRSHSSPELLHAVTHASSSDRLRMAS